MSKEITENVKDVRATVSVAIVAKDEGATIRECIESVRSVVDEIIVLVDETTTDDTFKIALDSGADLVQLYKWEDNFSKARNQAIEKCTKEWVLILDAHESLNPNSKPILTDLLKRVKIKEGPEALYDSEVFSASIYMNPQGDNIETMIPETLLMQPRLFKNNGDHYYKGRVHNYLFTEPINRGLLRRCFDLVLFHKRTDKNEASRKVQRKSMNIKCLLEDIAEDPNNSRAYFYLANTYFEIKDFENAKKYYEGYLSISTWNYERAQACLMLASIYAEENNFEKAKALLLDGLKEDWMRAEIYCELGDVAVKEKNYLAAEHWYKAACDKIPPIDHGMFLRGPCYNYLPYAKLAMVYSHIGLSLNPPDTEFMFKAIQTGEKAIELGYPESDLKNKITEWSNKMSLDTSKKNIMFYDENNTFTFLKDLCNEYIKKYNVTIDMNYDYNTAHWADVVWFEWCAKNILSATQLPKKEGQKWIVRLHGYELFSPARIEKIKWDKIDILIFVAEHVKRRFNDLYTIPECVRQIVIPNGIDLNNWDFANRALVGNNNIGVIGILTEKKGPQLLGQVIKYFDKHHPSYKFKLRLDVNEKPSLAYYTLMELIKDCDNYEFVNRQDSLNRWMEDIKFLLSTSTLESFSYVIGEAMSKGIKPLIHSWTGAKEIWPEKLIWEDIEGLEKLINGPYESKDYRKWIEKNYSVEKLVKSTSEIIDAFLKELK